MGEPRTVVAVFQKYQAARSAFALEIADLSGRPDCIEQLMQENVIDILKSLLTDVSLSIQQNAAIAVGKLAAHSPEIAEILDKEDVLRTLVYVNNERPHVRDLQLCTLHALRSIVKHNAALARSVVEVGGLDWILSLNTDDLDASIKEHAAFVLGYIARQGPNLALEVVAAGGVTMLVKLLQETEVNLYIVGSSALTVIVKQSQETAQAVIDAGAVPYFIRAARGSDPNLKRHAVYALMCIGEHSMDMTEQLIDVLPLVLQPPTHELLSFDVTSIQNGGADTSDSFAFYESTVSEAELLKSETSTGYYFNSATWEDAYDAFKNAASEKCKICAIGRIFFDAMFSEEDIATHSLSGQTKNKKGKKFESSKVRWIQAAVVYIMKVPAKTMRNTKAFEKEYAAGLLEMDSVRTEVLKTSVFKNYASRRRNQLLQKRQISAESDEE